MGRGENERVNTESCRLFSPGGILDYPSRRTVFLWTEAAVQHPPRGEKGREPCTRRSSLILGASRAPRGRQHNVGKETRGSFPDAGINCKLVYRPQRARSVVGLSGASPLLLSSLLFSSLLRILVSIWLSSRLVSCRLVSSRLAPASPVPFPFSPVSPLSRSIPVRRLSVPFLTGIPRGLEPANGQRTNFLL